MSKFEQLKEDLGSKERDYFEEGDVIRWTSAGRYIYAAVKTSAGWFTTAGGGNGNYFVDGRLNYEELLEVLRRSEVTGVMVADEWEPVI